MKTALPTLLVGAACALVACRKPEDKPHRTEPWLAAPSASAGESSSAPRRFHFAAGSRVLFSVAGRKAKVSGSAPVSAGSLELDARDLTHSSASVIVDLTALTLDDQPVPAGVELGGASATAQALQWLELGAEVAAEKRDELKLARFELSGVEGWSGVPLDFGGRRRVTVHATAVGTLLLHGFRAPVRAEVALTPQPGDAGGKPKLAIRSAGALVLALAPHEISARGPGGVVDAVATARASEWLGKNVRLELELQAEPD